MTIGPEPINRILWMSLRRGTLFFLLCRTLVTAAFQQGSHDLPPVGGYKILQS